MKTCDYTHKQLTEQETEGVARSEQRTRWAQRPRSPEQTDSERNKPLETYHEVSKIPVITGESLIIHSLEGVLIQHALDYVMGA